MQAQPEVFATLPPMLPTLEVKQGLVWSVGQNQDVSADQVGEGSQDEIKWENQKLHGQLSGFG